MAEPTISVIVPLYKTEPYVRACLDSIFSQEDAPPFEVIAVDDCSPDRCAEIAGEYDGLTLVKHESNRGLSEARNTGIRAARGKYLFFVDSDDTINPDTLSILWDHIKKHPGVDLVYGLTVCTPNDIELNSYLNLISLRLKDYDSNSESIRKSHVLIPEIAPNKLIRREWLLQHGLFFASGLLHEDAHWHLRAYGKVGSYAAERKTTTYNYILRSNSITGKQSAERKALIFTEILTSVLEEAKLFDAPLVRIYLRLLHLHRKFLPGGDRNPKMIALLDKLQNSTLIKTRHRILFRILKYYPSFLPPHFLMFAAR